MLVSVLIPNWVFALAFRQRRPDLKRRMRHPVAVKNRTERRGSGE
eukprot:symbB.v1.2.016305.t1/scaffold1238.1/size130040/1